MKTMQCKKVNGTCRSAFPNDSYSIELSTQVFQDSAVALPPLNPNLARKMLQEGLLDATVGTGVQRI